MMAISLATSPYPAAMEGWLPAPEAKEEAPSTMLMQP